MKIQFDLPIGGAAKAAPRPSFFVRLRARLRIARLDHASPICGCGEVKDQGQPLCSSCKADMNAW